MDDPSSAQDKKTTGGKGEKPNPIVKVSLQGRNHEMILILVNVNLREKLQEVFATIGRNVNKNLGEISETKITFKDLQAASDVTEARSPRSMRVCMQRNDLCYCYEDPPGICRPCWEDMGIRIGRRDQGREGQPSETTSETTSEIDISSNDKVKITTVKGEISRSIDDITRIICETLQIKFTQPSKIKIVFENQTTQPMKTGVQYSKVCAYFPHTDLCYCYEDPPGICRPCEPNEMN